MGLQDQLAFKNGQSSTVLLVDDEEVVRIIAARALRREGFNVLTANDAQSAISVCESQPGVVNLALLDCLMPGTTGLELLQTLRQNHPDIKALMMSAYPEPVALKTMPAPPRPTLFGFLQKPFTSAKLVNAVRDQLTRPFNAGSTTRQDDPTPGRCSEA
jgi:two-component system cell cycle sensor histidine kinase/response regulator CckA